MSKITLQLGLISLLLFLTTCKTTQLAQTTNKQIQLSERLEKIKMTDLNGKAITLHKYAGKPVMLNFWATWCGPCVSEMASLEEVYRQFKNDMVILAVSTEDLSKIQDFKKKQQLSFEFARLDIEYLDAYVVKLPTTMLINSAGQMISEEEGMRIWTDYNNLEKVKSLAKQ